MQRYHCAIGHGTGINSKISSGDVGLEVMRPDDDGFWVPYKDAIQAHEKDAPDITLGPWDTQTITVMPAQDELYKTLDKRTAQLINELYHSRDRLERALEDACALVEKMREALLGEAVRDAEGKAVSADIVTAWAGQFLDTHQDE